MKSETLVINLAASDPMQRTTARELHATIALPHTWRQRDLHWGEPWSCLRDGQERDLHMRGGGGVHHQNVVADPVEAIWKRIPGILSSEVQ